MTKPHRQLHTPIQHNPMPLWFYQGPGGSGGRVKYFVLAEDAAVLPVYAWRGDFDTATGDITPKSGETEPFELYYSNDSLSSPEQAKAGYSGHYEIDETGLKIFTFGPCVEGCVTASVLDPGTPPDGEVDTAYEHTVTIADLDVDGVSATGLPPGLSIDSGTGEITGTPTTEGTYWVTFMADSDDTPACPMTRIAKIVIWAEGEGPEPDPGGGA